MLKDLITRYNKIAYTHHYLMGIEDKGNIYVVHVMEEALMCLCTIDVMPSNRGGGCSLRFKPTRAQKDLLIGANKYILCSKEAFEEEVKGSKYNRGEIFEKLVTEHYAQEWKKDSVPFTQAGDIVVDGIHYQIKYQGATFCTERGLAKMEREYFSLS